VTSAQPTGHPLKPYPGGVKADVWVFSGQSNSQGWALMKAPIEPDPQIMFFDETNEWVPAQEPLNREFTRWTPPPFEQNILLQRDDVHLPAGTTPGSFLKQGGAIGGVGPVCCSRSTCEDM